MPRDAGPAQTLRPERPTWTAPRAIIWIAGGWLALFALITALVVTGVMSGLDVLLMNAGAALRGSAGDAIALWMSRGMGALGIGIAAAVYAAWLYRTKRVADAAMVAGAMVLGLALVTLIKVVVARARPELLPWIDAPTGASFPSGHAFANALFWPLVAVLTMRPWAWLIASVVPVAVGVSRVVCGVHWPSDVIAGWVLGIAIAMLALGVRARFPSASASAINARP